MAVTAEAAALTAAHQAQQAKNGAAAAYVAAGLILRDGNPEDIDSSIGAVIARLIPLLRGWHSKSSALGRAYYTGYRRLEVKGSDGFSLPDLAEFNQPQVFGSLHATGVADLKSRIGQIPRDADDLLRKAMTQRALRDTSVEFSGAAARQVMNGGRDEILNAVDKDRVALGYVRVTKANPCYYCAMLASRGPVYGEDSFDESDARFIGPGEKKVHDHCECSMEPVYSTAAGWPGRGKEFEGMWIDLSRELKRAPTINDWRRHYEGRANSA